MLRICWILVWILSITPTIRGQNAYVDSLLNAIVGLQKSKSDIYYNAGLFPSQRCYLGFRYNEKEDDNIFFTGLIVWTLKSIRDALSLQNQQLVDSIAARAIVNYPLYRNKEGGPTYNFWQTNPSRHFPNSKYFSSRSKYILPDDLDDTAIIYLSADFPDSLKQAVKQLIARHANGNTLRIRNTYKRYKNRKAYATWFGKNMPIDFDICVQANGLRFVLDNGFLLGAHDSATIHLISDMVRAGLHIKRPPYVAPHYQDAAIILYHLSRLVAAHPQLPELAALKPLLIRDIQKELLKTNAGMRAVLLQTSLLRLGVPVSTRIQLLEQDLDDFYFFVANMTSVFPNPIKGIFAKSRKINFYYKCRAYYLALLLEHEMYRLASSRTEQQ